jgi:hypothetical protein
MAVVTYADALLSVSAPGLWRGPRQGPGSRTTPETISPRYTAAALDLIAEISTGRAEPVGFGRIL